jgi:hypothetical protein
LPSGRTTDLPKLGIQQVCANPDYRPSKDDDRAERSEFAMQQGMAFGVEAYNEAMGWD